MSDLQGVSGPWTWMIGNAKFPVGDYYAKLQANGCNTTNIIHFDMDEAEKHQRYTPDLARRMARRVERGNNHDNEPFVTIFNSHLTARSDEYRAEHLTVWKDWHARWMSELVDRCEQHSVQAYQLVLEPHPEQAVFMAHALDRLRRIAPDAKVAFHDPLEGEWPVEPRGYDWYGDYQDFIDTDHHSVRRFQRPKTMVNWIRALDPRLGLLVVSQVELNGVDYKLPGWPGQREVADWDYPEVWQAIGARNTPQQPPVPEPEPDDPLASYDRDNRLFYRLVGRTTVQSRGQFAEDPETRELMREFQERGQMTEAERDKARRA